MGGQVCALSPESVGVLGAVTGMVTTGLITTDTIARGIIVRCMIITFNELRMSSNGIAGGFAAAFTPGVLPGSGGAVPPLL